MEEKKQTGKSPGQKYKSLLVWQYLLKHTDNDHAVKSDEIIAYLKEHGITAHRHSIASDIEELQTLFNKDAKTGYDKGEKLRYQVEYDAKQHGYKMVSRPYSMGELRMLSECVNSAKFLTERQAEHLKIIISEWCSEHQMEELENEVYLIGRQNSLNQHTLKYFNLINKAIRQNRKIRFKYLKHTLSNQMEQVERRKGDSYVVSPFQLLINDGNYYLLSYDSQKQDMRTFRIDRMKEVALLEDLREGSEVFREIDLRTYTKRVFHMFGGEQKRVQMRFTNRFLDTVVDRFGTNGDTTYMKSDDYHFVVSADVEISDQFYSWICGFRKHAAIVSPPDVVDGMKKFLSDISTRYEEK